MRLKRIFNQGRVINEYLYNQLQELDERIFPNCGNEFLKNRDWWVIEVSGKIIAYCGCLYSEGVCIFNRAWVSKDYRCMGIQKRMIKARIKAAKDNAARVITYTTNDNVISANNLFKMGFRLYEPSYKWVGKGYLYFGKDI